MNPDTDLNLIADRQRPHQASPHITFFTVTKPFEGLADTHQRNALASWKALGPEVEIILFSDTPVPDDIRAEYDCRDVMKTNDEGTPLLDEVFRVAAEDGQGKIRVYSNADIILDQRFKDTIKDLEQSDFQSWLAIGKRTELSVTEQDLAEPGWVEACFARMKNEGKLASIVCKDYFAFTSDLFRDIPEFAVGRGNWDNWMVCHAKEKGIPVVDVTETTPVIHQEHEYQHVKGGRYSVYVNGQGAKENQRLAGGRNLVKGSTANWKLGRAGIRRIRAPWHRFWIDLPNFLSLMRNLLFFRYLLIFYSLQWI